MSSIKNILFPFDSEIRSEQSFNHAIEIAQKHQGNLIFLYTIRLENPEKSRSASGIRKQIIDSSDRRLQEVKTRFNLESLYKYEFHTEIGFLASRVLLKIKEHPIDLLVIEKDLLPELNAESHKIACPIIIIPH